MTEVLSTICAAVYLGGLIAAAGYDLVSYTIPNRIVLLVALAGAVGLVAGTPDLSRLAQTAGVAVVVLAVGALLFALKLWGAGDAKLLAAAALATGTKGLPALVLWTVLAGGAIAGGLLILRRTSTAKQMQRNRVFGSLFAAEKGIPYGVAIAVGGIVALIQGGTTFTGRLIEP